MTVLKVSYFLEIVNPPVFILSLGILPLDLS